MLQVSNVELPDATVCSHTCKDVSFLGEVDVVDLFIMSDELGEDCCLFDIPDSAGGVDGASSDEVVELGVPVEGSQGSWEVIVLYRSDSYIFEVQLKRHLLVVFDLPYLEALT